MNLDHVHEFVTLAETGNYLKAADTLFIAQSALSRHIQGLEKELGVKLFNRTTRSIELTEYGKIFLPYARSILKIQYEYSTKFYNLMNNIGGTITVGCLPVSVPYRIPEILAKFSRENKNFSISLTNDDSIEQLREHTADFIFLRDTGSHYNDIAMLPFDSDILAALLPIDHPLACRSSLRLEELKNEHFLLLSKNSQMYKLCTSSCIAAGFEPHIAYAGSQAENMLALVREKIGVGLLTKKPLRHFDCNGIAIVDIEPKITTNICLAYLKDANLSIGATHFINCVKSFITDRGNLTTL